MGAERGARTAEFIVASPETRTHDVRGLLEYDSDMLMQVIE